MVDDNENNNKRKQEGEDSASKKKSKAEAFVAGFYNVDFFSDKVEDLYSKSKPEGLNLEGKYNILFHRGWDGGGGRYENRTSNGTAEFKSKKGDDGTIEFSGTVKYDPAISKASGYIYQQPYNVNEGKEGIHKYSKRWNISFEALLEDPGNFGQFEPAELSLYHIKKKAAFPRVNRDDDSFGGYKDNELYEEFDMVKFKDLAAAEELAKDHEADPKGKPPPVFFMLPGDLVLDVNWGDHRDMCLSTTVLRKVE